MMPPCVRIMNPRLLSNPQAPVLIDREVVGQLVAVASEDLPHHPRLLLPRGIVQPQQQDAGMGLSRTVDHFAIKSLSIVTTSRASRTAHARMSSSPIRGSTSRTAWTSYPAVRSQSSTR